jgi:hypothetical protein
VKNIYRIEVGMKSRRDFLKNLGLVSATSILYDIYPRWAQASSFITQYQKNNLLILVMEGGWDVTLGTDPWISNTPPNESDMFIEYDQQSVFRYQNMNLGPAMKSMQAYASDFSIVNGVFVSSSDNGHLAASLYMATGDGGGHAASLPVELLQSHDEQRFGIIANRDVYLGPRSASVLNFNNILTQNSSSAKSNISYPNVESPLGRSRNLLISNEQALNQYWINLDKIKKLKPEYSTDQNLNPIFVAIAAFKTGLSRAANIVLNGSNLDTHSTHPQAHLNAQDNLWKQVAEAFYILKNTPGEDGASSLLDNTLVMVTSEFSRTPALNAAKGKDHNPMTNSVLIAGCGIKSGLSIGGSRLVTSKESSTQRSYHIGLPSDLQTGRAITKRDQIGMGQIIKPETVLVTAVEALGLPRYLFGSVSVKEKSISSVLK